MPDALWRGGCSVSSKALLKSISDDADLQDLPLAVGANPSRQPPSLESINKARKNVAHALNISAAAAERKHYAGKWGYNIVEAVQIKSDDPDVSLPNCLKHGAPTGILEPITPGNLFPACHSQRNKATSTQLFGAKAIARPSAKGAGKMAHHQARQSSQDITRRDTQLVIAPFSKPNKNTARSSCPP